MGEIYDKKEILFKEDCNLFIDIDISMFGWILYLCIRLLSCKDYEVSNVDIKQQDNYTVYGDTNSKTGFIFYPGGKVEAKSYEPILTSLSEKGICVVLVEMPFNLAVINSNAADKVMSKFNNIEKLVHWRTFTRRCNGGIICS